MDYETIIGLEIHSQLLTRSKMFCRCAADYTSASPNTHVCPICLGMPGVLPTINRKAIEYVIMTALALNCSIPEFTKFDRKNYPYPDLMKGYQISQYDFPIGVRGHVTLEMGDAKTISVTRREIRITRVHLEEDVAKLVHRDIPWGDSYSLVDVNRSGVPLMEIVTEPDMRSPEEARQLLIKLQSILRYLGVSTCNMEEGSFRCDANISIRPIGAKEGFAKAEVKNMNSFKAVFLALEYEAIRQRKVVEQGGHLIQETRGWLEEGTTVSQRSKEYAHDYRYFPEPDLPPLTINPSWVEEIRSQLPELPEIRQERLVEQYGLSFYDASILTSSKPLADYFESCMKLWQGDDQERKAKILSNWLLGDFAHLLNENNIEIDESRVTPSHLIELLKLIEEGAVSGPAAKKIIEDIFHTGKRAGDIVVQQGLTQITDASDIEVTVKQVIGNHPQAVSDFILGKQQALTFLVGQIMRMTKGRVNPKLANEVMRRELEKLC